MFDAFNLSCYSYVKQKKKSKNQKIKKKNSKKEKEKRVGKRFQKKKKIEESFQNFKKILHHGHWAFLVTFF